MSGYEEKYNDDTYDGYSSAPISDFGRGVRSTASYVAPQPAHDRRDAQCILNTGPGRIPRAAVDPNVRCPACYAVDGPEPKATRLNGRITALEQEMQIERERARQGIRLQEHSQRARAKINTEITVLKGQLADLTRPPEPNPCQESPPLVVVFKKRWPGGVYHYAAVRVGTATEYKPRRWAVTQSNRAPNRQPMMSWRELTEFMGEEFWPSIVEYRPVPTSAPVLDLSVPAGEGRFA